MAAPTGGRLLLLNERDPLHPRAGGAEVHIAEIAERLAARGFESVLASCSFRGAAARERVGALEVWRLGPLPIYYPRVAWTSVRESRRGRFDVVVEHLNKLPFFSPVLSRVPVLCVAHHLFGRSAFQQVPWPVASLVVAAELTIPLLYRRKHFVAVSDSTRDDLVRRGIPPERIRVIHNGIAAVSGSSLPASRRGSHVVYFGRLEPYKRVDLLLEAATVLVERIPALTIDIVGRGSDRPRLERIARELGIANRTRFHGFVDDAARDEILGRARVCVCPSVKEGWGITVIEANAFGVPVVATDAPGLRDAVRHEQTGFLVGVEDPAPWAARIEQILTDDALADRLGAAARDWSREFNWDLAADRFALEIASVREAR
jgi:glycosyltransferase involved in cell wall biosynthesis